MPEELLCTLCSTNTPGKVVGLPLCLDCCRSHAWVSHPDFKKAAQEQGRKWGK